MPDNMHTGIELKKLHFWYSTFIMPDNMHTGIEFKNLHFFVNDCQLKKAPNTCTLCICIYTICVA